MAIQIARHWRMKSQRYQLAGHICTQCNSTMLQARAVCPTCTEEITETTETVNNNAILIQVPHPEGLVIYHRKFNPNRIKVAVS